MDENQRKGRDHSVPEDPAPGSHNEPAVFAEDFLHFLLEGNVKFTMRAFCRDELVDGAGVRTSTGVIEDHLREFTGRVMTFIDKKVEELDCHIDGDYAVTRFAVSWAGLMAGSLKRETFSGVATVRMKRSPYEGWDVVQAIVPGWNA